MPNDTSTPHQIADRAVRAVLDVLPRSVKIAESSATGADLVVAGHPLSIKWVGEGSLGRVRNMLAHAPAPPDIVVARTLSPGARALLAEAGVGWVDETGAAEIASGSVIVSRTGRPVREVEPPDRWTPSILAIGEALLCGTKPTVAATSAATGLSTGSCTTALRFLDQRGFLEADAARGPMSGRRVVNPDDLLEAYAREAASAPEAPSLEVGAPSRDLLATVAEAGRQWALHEHVWAVTGTAAAAVLAPLLTSLSAVEVYVDTATSLGLEAFAERGQLRPIAGGRILLRPFPTAATKRLATTVGDLRVAPWPRVFVDLRQTGVRGEEAAEHLREKLHGS